MIRHFFLNYLRRTGYQPRVIEIIGHIVSTSTSANNFGCLIKLTTVSNGDSINVISSFKKEVEMQKSWEVKVKILFISNDQLIL